MWRFFCVCICEKRCFMLQYSRHIFLNYFCFQVVLVEKVAIVREIGLNRSRLCGAANDGGIWLRGTGSGTSPAQLLCAPSAIICVRLQKRKKASIKTTPTICLLKFALTAPSLKKTGNNDDFLPGLFFIIDGIKPCPLDEIPVPSRCR